MLTLRLVELVDNPDSIADEESLQPQEQGCCQENGQVLGPVVSTKDAQPWQAKQGLLWRLGRQRHRRRAEIESSSTCSVRDPIKTLSLPAAGITKPCTHSPACRPFQCIARCPILALRSQAHPVDVSVAFGHVKEWERRWCVLAAFGSPDLDWHHLVSRSLHLRS